jgi:hypothetical protein
MIDQEVELLGDNMHDTHRRLLEKIEQIEKDIYLIKVIVAGNGDSSKSLVVRFDRMEQAHERSNWLVRTALGASISSIVGIAAILIKHFFFHP